MDVLNHPSPLNIKRVSKLDPVVFEREYMERGLPVIIRGAINDWKALSRWMDLEYIREKIGHRRVRVSIAKRSIENNGKHEEIFVSNYIDGLKQGENYGYYLADTFLQDLPELLNDIGIPPYFDNGVEHYLFSPWHKRFGGKRLLFRMLFFGRDTITPTHHHVYNQALVCQIVGVKRMLLFPPEQSVLLYPETFLPVSRVDPDHPDITRFPKFGPRNANRSND